MIRRALLVLLTLAVASMIVQAAMGRTTAADDPPSGVARAAEPGRPNIVLITTDDQAVTDLRWMPETTRLLRDAGLDFRQMLSPHPLCCPARAEILTGQYAQNNGVRSNGGPYGGLAALADPENTLGTWLQAGGYRTGLIGKYLNQYSDADGVQPGWDYWNVAANNAFGYRSFVMYDNGTRRRFERSDGAYSTDYVTDHTVEQIDEWSGEEADGDQPFFLWASYYAPHGLCGEGAGCAAPPEPARRHERELTDVRSPHLRARSATAPLRDAAPIVDRALSRLPSRAALQRHFTRRIQALQSVDEGVARILGALEAQGELDNTYVMFTSDNGYLLGEHHYLGKVVPYEESLRVPLFVRGPDVPAGAVRRQPVTTVDLAPTILDLAGATPGRDVDGRSLMPSVRDHALAGDTVLIQGGPPAGEPNPKPWLYRGVRTERYTFVSWKMYAGGRPFYELYDRVRDPAQIHNLWRDDRYRGVRRALMRRTAALAGCSGADACFRDFGPLPAPRR